MTYLMLKRNQSPIRRAMDINRSWNRLFDDPFFQLGTRWMDTGDVVDALAVDLSETDAALILETALPGFSSDMVDISVTNNILTIKAERAPKKDEDENKAYHIQERDHVTLLERNISLPVDVNADKATAVFSNGVLTLTLPKVEEVKPKRISVKVK